VGAAQLADELQRRGVDLLIGRGRLEVVEIADIAAHETPPDPWVLAMLAWPYHRSPTPEATRAHRHARHDPAHDRHRLLSAPAMVRPQPGRPLVQDGDERFAVPRAVPRCGRQH